MAFGDFGTHVSSGFDTCYNKTVDRPQHFRQRPRCIGGEPPCVSESRVRDTAPRPDFTQTARYGCKLRDHNDLLHTNAASNGSAARSGVRHIPQEPTELIRNIKVGGDAAPADGMRNGVRICTQTHPKPRKQRSQ